MDETFLRCVEHDLRGELATMLAGVHYLARYEKSLGPEARRILDRVQAAGQRLTRLVEELGDSHWIEATAEGEASLSPGRHDAATLVAAALERVAALAASRGVSIEPSAPATPIEILGDRDLLVTALRYVLEFAVLRSRERPVRVETTVVEGRPAVLVRDDAGPVPATRRERLLEPFGEKELLVDAEQGPRRRERLGLGLCIARGILFAHHGDLQVEPSPGDSGLTIRLVLGGASEGGLLATG